MFDSESKNIFAPLRLRLQAARFVIDTITDAGDDCETLVAQVDAALAELDLVEAKLRRGSALAKYTGLLGYGDLLATPAVSTSIN